MAFTKHFKLLSWVCVFEELYTKNGHKILQTCQNTREQSTPTNVGRVKCI